MRRVIEFDCVTKSEANRRGNTTIAQVIHAKEVKAQRATVREALANLGTPPPLHVVDLGGGRFGRPGAPGSVGFTVDNKITVNFTRIAPGTLDDDNIGASLKHVRDEVAAWCGVPNDRDPIYKWSVPPAQEKAAPGVYRVRIEILDKLTGEERIVKLAETRSAGVEADRRVKKAIRDQLKSSGVYHADEAAKGASSSARAKAERLFAKATGKPSALDLRDAYLGVVKGAPGAEDLVRAMMPKRPARDVAELAEARAKGRDPGEERSAKSITGCTTCGAVMGFPCVRKDVERLVFGVHVARARAAGLHVPDDDRDHVKPARAPKGPRKLAPIAQPELPLQRAFVALPWENVCEPCRGIGRFRLEDGGESLCTICGGSGEKIRSIYPAPRYDGADEPPQTIPVAVPAHHVASYGEVVTLHRSKFTSKRTGACWLYTVTKGPETT